MLPLEQKDTKECCGLACFGTGIYTQRCSSHAGQRGVSQEIYISFPLIWTSLSLLV